MEEFPYRLGEGRIKAAGKPEDRERQDSKSPKLLAFKDSPTSLTPIPTQVSNITSGYAPRKAWKRSD